MTPFSNTVPPAERHHDNDTHHIWDILGRKMLTLDPQVANIQELAYTLDGEWQHWSDVSRPHEDEGYRCGGWLYTTLATWSIWSIWSNSSLGHNGHL